MREKEERFKDFMKLFELFMRKKNLSVKLLFKAEYFYF